MATVFVLLATVLAADGVSIASPGLSAVNLPEKEAQFFSDHFAQQLAVLGPRVVTQSEISQLLGLERQKQLLGCGEESSCAAEIGNALGVDALVAGSLGKFGDDIAVNLKILSAKDGAQLAVFTSTVKGTPLLVPELKRAARKMVPDLYRALGRPAPTLPPEEGVITAPQAEPARKIPASFYVFAGGGVALGVAAVALRIDAASRADALRTSPGQFVLSDARQQISTIQTENLVMVGAAAASAACLGIAAWRFFSAPVEATAWVSPGSSGVAIGGAF